MERPRRTVLSVIVASLVGLGLLTGIGVVVVYENWNGNIDHRSINGQLKHRPKKHNEALNVLVLGDDTRAGKGNGIDNQKGGGGSDTTILFHLSADRTFAYGISIPRDTAVKRPICYRKDGSEIPASTGWVKWNEAYAVGGAACTQQQLEQLTGVHVDKYVVVDFAGFKDMVNALGGVETCLPLPIDSYGIHLAAGTHLLNGAQALGYARARHGISGGIDPYRTRRQQALIGAMIKTALGRDMLARPDRVIGFLNAATSSLQTDFANFAAIAKVAVSARGIGADNIRFVTTPWVLDDSKVSGGVAWLPSVAKLWRLVREDKPLTPEFVRDSLSAADRPDGMPSTPANPSAPSAPSAPPTSSTSSPSSSPTASPSGGGGGMTTEERAKAGLCS